MTLKANILEMFQSIQGEGKYVGARQVFVRFFECNMHCVWCDTPHSIGDTTRRYKEYTLDELNHAINDLSGGCHSVSLTGGEPLLQTPFIKSLLPLLKQKSLLSYLETNGIFHEELKTIIDDIDIVAMDIKLPSSTKEKPFWHEHAEFLKVARTKDAFIKTVVSSDTTKEDVDRAVELVADVDPDILFILQPNTYDMQNGVVKKCVAFQEDCLKKLKHVRVMPQMHKFMKLR
jgi:7-carboxy-7-deazaguanine synthase